MFYFIMNSVRKTTGSYANKDVQRVFCLFVFFYLLFVLSIHRCVYREKNGFMRNMVYIENGNNGPNS